jgi:hypothetical protein
MAVTETRLHNAGRPKRTAICGEWYLKLAVIFRGQYQTSLIICGLSNTEISDNLLRPQFRVCWSEIVDV